MVTRIGKLAIVLALGIWAFAGAQDLPPDFVEKSIPQKLIPSLETSLQRLSSLARDNPTGALRLAASLGLELREDKICVVVEYKGELDRAGIAGLGGEILGYSDRLGIAEVAIPPASLDGLASLRGVRFVRRPYRPVPSVASEGVSLIGAAAWHTAGYMGAGIRVAVIDLGFAGYSTAVMAGELDNVLITRDYTGTGFESGTEHGTACAEIVHDVAPRAELILMKIGNEVDLANAVSDAISAGAHVITHSAGWFNTNFYDGTGIICDIVRGATDAGILWVNAAGNSADGPHWEGDWNDPDGDGILDFAPGDEVNDFYVDAGTQVSVYLTWNDWPTSAQDYDLYLVDGAGNVMARSEDVQAGSQPPTEAVHFAAPASGTYGIVVVAHEVTSFPRLEIFCYPYSVRLEYAVEGSSIPAPGNAAESLTVGALAWDRWDTGPQEPFSSQGPTNDGRVKPDLCAPDRVSTLLYGPQGFSGTSAAAPHVAGAAALVWSTNPDKNTTWVRHFLEGNAADMGAPGRDNVYGNGKLDLPGPGTPVGGNTHTYRPGWNMVSIPVIPGEVAFAGGAPVLYHYDPTLGRYETITDPNRMEPTLGYWIYVPAGGLTLTVQGSTLTADVSIELGSKGWHQISSPWTYPVDSIHVVVGGEEKSWAQAVAAGWVGSVIWGYEPGDGYFVATALDPWEGYWLYLAVPSAELKLYMAEGR